MLEIRAANSTPGYQIFVLVFSLFAIVALAARTVVAMDPEMAAILNYADDFACALFFGDFLLSLWRAPNRRRYFLTWGWLDLLSSIPTVDVARWGRVARIARLFRVLRGFRATRVLTALLLRHRAENAVFAAAIVALLLIVFSSIAVLHVETDPESNIKTAEDALWWAFATVTTVGYGDYYPTTSEGRFIAAILMCVGVGLFGTFSGFLAAWFLAPDEAATDFEIAALRQEVGEIPRLLEQRRYEPGQLDPGEAIIAPSHEEDLGGSRQR